MSIDATAIIIAILSSIVTLISLIHNISRNKAESKKAYAEAAEKLTTSALSIVNQLEEHVGVLSNRVKYLDGKLNDYHCQLLDKEDRIKLLESQVQLYEEQLEQKSKQIDHLESALLSREERITALEQRIKELEEHGK